MIPRRFALAYAWMPVVCALPVGADILTLKDGGAVRGQVFEEADAVVLQTGRARITYPRAMVARIEYERPLLRRYLERVDALPSPPSADDFTTLGVWCRENALDERARDAFEQALRLDSEYAAARKALGYVRMEDRWVTEEEMHAALGEVRFHDRWVPREQQAAVLESEKALREARALLERLARDREQVNAAERRAREEAARKDAERRQEDAQAKRREEEMRRNEEAGALRPARSWTLPSEQRQIGGGARGWGPTWLPPWNGAVLFNGSWLPARSFDALCPSETLTGPALVPCRSSGAPSEARSAQRASPVQAPPPQPSVTPPIPASAPPPGPLRRLEGGSLGRLRSGERRG